MGLLGVFSVCKGQENAEQPTTMPGRNGVRHLCALFHFFS